MVQTIECYASYTIPGGDIAIAFTRADDGWSPEIDEEIAELDPGFFDNYRDRDVPTANIWYPWDIPRIQPGDIHRYHITKDGSVYAERFTGNFRIFDLSSGQVFYRGPYREDIDWAEVIAGLKNEFGKFNVVISPDDYMDCDKPVCTLQDLLPYDPAALGELLEGIELR